MSSIPGRSTRAGSPIPAVSITRRNEKASATGSPGAGMLYRPVATGFRVERIVHRSDLQPSVGSL